MPSAAVSVENLSKAYRIGLAEEIPDTFVAAATGWLKAPLRNFHRLRRLNAYSANGDAAEDDIIWALRDVSFEVAEGEVLGIIGRNGAGKSTLLKILSRITEPTGGRAVIRGRVSSLLEVGTGFHAELTGRENIYLNGTILGMRKREIDRKLEEIIDFSGVEKFLDTPVKRYSSGMKVRLAFAVAAHLEPEILIIDEVLAVGDAEFQKKCLGKMQDVARGGRTVLFVSHNMSAVGTLCSRAIVLQDGAVSYSGPVEEAISEYLRQFETEFVDLRGRTDRGGTGEARFAEITFLTADDQPMDHAYTGGSLTIRVTIESTEYIRNPQCNLVFHTNRGQRLFRLSTVDWTSGKWSIHDETHLRCTVPSLCLLPGSYLVTARLFGQGGNLIDEVDQAAFISVLHASVQGSRRIPGTAQDPIFVPCSWELSSRRSIMSV